MIELSEHAEIRMAQRSLSEDDLDYVLAYGECIHQGGAEFYYLRRCDVPSDDRADDERTRLVGTTLVVSPDGNVAITAYRNRSPKALRCLRRKADYALTRQQRRGWN